MCWEWLARYSAVAISSLLMKSLKSLVYSSTIPAKKIPTHHQPPKHHSPNAVRLMQNPLTPEAELNCLQYNMPSIIPTCPEKHFAHRNGFLD